MERVAVCDARSPDQYGLNDVAEPARDLLLHVRLKHSGAIMHPSSSVLSRAARRVLAVATLSLLGSPLVGHADAVEQAMDACVQTFVAASLPKGQRVVVDKANMTSGPLDAQSRAYRIVLKATGTTSGRQIAKGVCVANRDGEVIAFNGRRPPKLAQAIASNETAAR
jgi:hypothetical protein